MIRLRTSEPRVDVWCCPRFTGSCFRVVEGLVVFGRDLAQGGGQIEVSGVEVTGTLLQAALRGLGSIGGHRWILVEAGT
jgi:hypothetical protein